MGVLCSACAHSLQPTRRKHHARASSNSVCTTNSPDRQHIPGRIYLAVLFRYHISQYFPFRHARFERASLYREFPTSDVRFSSQSSSNITPTNTPTPTLSAIKSTTPTTLPAKNRIPWTSLDKLTLALNHTCLNQCWAYTVVTALVFRMLILV